MDPIDENVHQGIHLISLIFRGDVFVFTLLQITLTICTLTLVTGVLAVIGLGGYVLNMGMKQKQEG